MGRLLSVSAEQLRSIDDAAQVLPPDSRNMFRFHVVCTLQKECGSRAVTDADINRALDRAFKMMPVPALALLEGVA